MPGLCIIPQKSPLATQAVVFDFNSFYPIGTTAFVSSASFTASVWTGTDPNPSGVISGSPALVGLVVSQLFTGGVAGVLYKITCTAHTSDGQTLIQYGYMAVVAEPL